MILHKIILRKNFVLIRTIDLIHCNYSNCYIKDMKHNSGRLIENKRFENKKEENQDKSNFDDKMWSNKSKQKREQINEAI